MRILDWLALGLAWVVRGLISLRYKTEIKGLEEIDREDYSHRGMLFLPNHPAQIDPILLELILWKKYRPRPLVIDYFYYFKGVQWAMHFIKALPIPNFEVSINKWKLKKLEKIFEEVGAGLDRGEHFLVYPSGKLKLTGEEKVGGTSFIADLMRMHPDTQIVLVRITGLWGSTFSRACTGQVPDFARTVWNGFKVLLKNLIFFVPRRKISIELEKVGDDFPKGGDRLEINRYLEKWYNQYPDPGPEPLKLVSFYFWKKAFPHVAEIKEEKKETGIAIPEEIERDVKGKIAEIAQKNVDDIEKSQMLSADLGFDSLDIATLYFFIDERYDIEGVTPGEFENVEDVFLIAAGKKEPTEKPEKGFGPRKPWPKEKDPKPVSLPVGNTIGEAFLNSCKRMGSAKACADLTSGMLSYKQMKIAAMLLAKKLEKIPEKNVGIMLPSSIAAYLTIFAVTLAKKVPVMLNWTAGVRSLDHSVEVAEIKTVITSSRFLDTLGDSELGKIEDQFLYIEDLKREISFFDKIKALFASVDLSEIKEDDTAAILFTSGTESLPKAVPLTHKNLLSNQKASLSFVEILRSDILLGALPPFHSFGFNVTGILPILAGLRVSYSPDPTDGHRLAKEVEQWKITLFCSAPSFIRMLLQVATEEQLRSVRLFVAGAEKTPPELFDAVTAELIEGYGITECGPIVAISRPGKPPIGVGEPLPGTELLIIDPETAQKADEGEICICSDSVFPHYLGIDTDPFVIIDGKKWYRSGDRGRIDESGALILSGRLKRFVKIGGEMVSLGGLEEDLIRLAKEKKWVSAEIESPFLALSFVENGDEKAQIVLFTTFPVKLEDVNIALKESGYGRIVKIKKVHQVDEIPVTGTGKIHYRALDDMRLS